MRWHEPVAAIVFGCIVLGHGEGSAGVRHWLTVAAGAAQFIGFAVGRTVFRDLLTA